MARPTTVHVCSDCGHTTPRWHGQCPGCHAWNTLVEERTTPAATGGGGRRAAAALRPVPLADVPTERVPRLTTSIGELDRVLGGGVVPGSLVLLGGSPGIGKSTLTYSALGHLAGAGRKTLFVSGEESAAQIRLRAERLGADALRVPVLGETDLDAVVATIEAERPEVCVIDSVQTLHAGEQQHGPGHDAAAEHPVELADAGRAHGGRGRVDLADRQRGRRHRPGADRARGGRADLADRAPRLALGAAADPPRRALAALGAAVRRSGGGLRSHAEDGRAGV